jgi:hypothetical protein
MKANALNVPLRNLKMKSSTEQTLAAKRKAKEESRASGSTMTGINSRAN